MSGKRAGSSYTVAAWAGILVIMLSLQFSASTVAAGETPQERFELIRRIVSERGEYDLAESQLKTFVEEFQGQPIAAEALVLLGYTLDKQKKNQEAAAAYSRVLTENPDSPPAFKADAALGAADAWFRLGKFDDAAKRYAEVLDYSQRPEQLEAALLWRAEANYRKALEDQDAGRDFKSVLDAAFADFAAFIVRYPEAKNLPAAVSGAAFAAFDAGEYEKALPYFRRFGDEFSDDRRYEECLYYTGETLYRLKRYDEARLAFNQVREKRPDSAYAADARAGVAWADHGLGRIAAAAEGFEEAAKLAGADRELELSYLYDAGCAWREAGNLDQASPPLQKVAEATDHPLNGLAWFRLGTLWQERAKEARDKARDTRTPEEAKRMRAAQKEIGERAIGYLQKAVSTGKLGAEEIEAKSILGEVLLDAERHEDAAKTFAEIVSTWPNSDRAPWALYHEALSYREQSLKTDGDAAGAFLRKAAAALRDCLKYPNAKVRLQAAWALADYLGMLGDVAESREHYRWLSSDGVKWAKEWRGTNGRGDPELESRAVEYAADSLFRLGESHYFANDLPRAGGFYQEIVTNHPGGAQAAMALLRLGEIAEGGKDFTVARNRYEETLVLGARLGKNRVGSTIAYAQLRLGAMQLRDGQRETDEATKRKLFQDALKNLSAVAEAPPTGMNMSRVRYYLAETKYSLGLKEEARTDYEKSIADDPKGEVADAAWFGLAWVKRDLKDLSAASEACRRVVDDFPASSLRPDAMVLMASIKREQKDAAGALADLASFIAEYPGHRLAAKAELERASALDETGDHAAAATAFQKFLADHPDHPDTAQALFQRSWALWNQIRPKKLEAREAEKEWRRLSNGLEPDDIPEIDRIAALKARDEMQSANETVRVAENEILASLRELTERYPDYPVADAAWLRIGEILYDREEHQQASNAYRRSLSLAEERKSDLADKAQYRLAWSIQRLAEASERAVRVEVDSTRREASRKEMWDRRLAAIEAFESILGKFPDSDLAGEACFLAAELRRRSGQDTLDEQKRSGWFATAGQRYQQALDKSTSESSYRRAAEYGSGLVLLLDKKYAEARERFTKFLFDYADGAYTQEAYWGLGQANLELGAYVDAGVAFEKALTLDKMTETAAKARYGLGFVAALAGDREKARLEFLAVDALYPQYPVWAASALVQSARTALMDGLTEKAIGDLERVLARYPNTPAADEARELQAKIAAGDLE